MGIFEDLTGYMSAAKTALDLFKGIRAEMPQGPLSEEAGKQIQNAEKALKASEAKLAQSLGYSLCQCTFPPQIMLWNEKKQATYCPNPDCGREECFEETVQFRPDFF